MYPYLVTLSQHGLYYTNRFATYGEAVAVYIEVLCRETPGVSVCLSTEASPVVW